LEKQRVKIEKKEFVDAINVVNGGILEHGRI